MADLFANWMRSKSSSIYERPLSISWECVVRSLCWQQESLCLHVWDLFEAPENKLSQSKSEDLRTRGTLPGSACRTCLLQKGHRQIWSATWSQFHWNRLETLEWNDCRVGADKYDIAAEYTRPCLAIHCLCNQEEKHGKTGPCVSCAKLLWAAKIILATRQISRIPPTRMAKQRGQMGTASVCFGRLANSASQVEPKPKHELQTRKVRTIRILNLSAVDMQ